MTWIGEVEVDISQPRDSSFLVYNPEKGQLVNMVEVLFWGEGGGGGGE